MPKLVEFCVKRSFSGCNTVYQLGFTRLIHTIRCKNLCRNTYVYVHISVDGQLYILVLVTYCRFSGDICGYTRVLATNCMPFTFLFASLELTKELLDPKAGLDDDLGKVRVLD